MLRVRIAAILGIALVLLWPFVNWDPLLSHLPYPGMMLPLLLTTVLAAIAFGICKRPPKLYGFRRIDRRDLAAALVAFVAVFAVVAAASPVVSHLAAAQPPLDSTNDTLRDDPLWLALVTAVAAGVFEEFIYRGFLIEELGPLIRSRYAAAAISVVFFGMAHHVNNGWSWDLLYPALIGAVITVLYLRRHNLPLCMLLHATLDSLHALTR